MNSLEVDGAKVHVHLVLFAYDVVGFHVPGHRTGDLTVYDYVRNPSPTLGESPLNNFDKLHFEVKDAILRSHIYCIWLFNMEEANRQFVDFLDFFYLL